MTRPSAPPRPVLLLASLALAAGVAAPAAVAAASPVLPGYWEYKLSVLGIPAKTERQCVKPEEVERFFPEICTRHYTCTYPVKQVRAGKVKLQGVWTDKKGREAPVSASGVYTRESFDMDVKLKTINGLPLSGAMSAKRLDASCPATPPVG